MPPTSDAEARAALADWLAGEHRWLTVVGEPGLDLAEWVRESAAPSALGAIGFAGSAPPAVSSDVAPADGRIICVDHRRHRYAHEVVIEVPPLSPDESRVRLLRDARRAGISISDDDAAAIAGRIGGHRQALQLAARRLTTLTAPELLARFDAPPARGLDPLMHGTMPPWDGIRQAFEGAIAPLPAAAIRTLSAAALFVDGFTATDLSAICGGDRLDAIQALRDRCLLRRRSHGLVLSPIVRRFARACLEPAPSTVVGRHRAWRRERAARLASLARKATPDAARRIAADEQLLRALIEPAPPEMTSDEIADGIQDGRDAILDDTCTIGDDMDGIPDGMETAHPGHQAACDAGLALAALYEHRRSIEDQRRVAARAARASADLDEGRQVAAHVAAARACRLAGDTDAALAWLEAVRGHGAPGATGSPASRFAWCHERCALATLTGERRVAEGLADAALEAARALDEPLTEARALINLGVVRHGLHDLDGARAAYTAARAISRRLGANRLLSISALNVCLVDVWCNRLDAARAAGEEALDAFVALGDRRGEGSALNNLGMIAFERGMLDMADARFAAAEAVHAAIGFRQHQAYAMFNRAEVALERGDRATHARLIAAVAPMNTGHADATAGPGPLHDRALGLALTRSRITVALLDGALDAAARHLADGWSQLGEESVPAERVELELLAIELALARGDRDGSTAALARAEASATDDRRRARQRADLMRLAVEPDGARAAERLAEGLAARDVSLALRRTLRAIWPMLPRTLRREARAQLADGPSVCLDAETHALRLPDGRWVSLDRRRLVWTLLIVLFEADEALAPDAVIAAVWPGEQIHPDAASNRLYNAVALLRKTGLGKSLERVEAGYRLAPTLRRVRVSAQAIATPG